jgi:myosin-5
MFTDLLNEEAMRPKGDDKSFVSKLSTMHKDLPFLSFPRRSPTQFTISHYAGDVT